MAGIKITKADILDGIYGETGINRSDIRRVVDLFLGTVKNALAEGAAIEMRGFGTFEVRTRKGRSKARNPRTGGLIAVRSHGAAVFRPGRELKAAVWNTGPARLEDDGSPPPDSQGAVPRQKAPPGGAGALPRQDAPADLSGPFGA